MKKNISNLIIYCNIIIKLNEKEDKTQKRICDRNKINLFQNPPK